MHDPNNRGKRHQSRREWIPAAHLFTLWAFAVAQPLFDLVGREPDFLVAHHLTGVSLAAGVIGLALGPPTLLATPFLLPAFRRSRAWRFWTGGFCALFAAALLLQLLHRIPDLAALALATAGGICFAIFLQRSESFSNLVAIAAIAAVVAPAVFLLRPGVRGLVPTTSGTAFEPDAAIASAPAVRSDVPVVMLVFDELPVSSLQMPDASINKGRFPNFAALAEESTWYQRAVTTGTKTTKALPALVTGRLPRPESTAHYHDHTLNLFTWLAAKGGYQVVAREEASQLCPPAVCTDRVLPHPWRRLVATADDLTMVYGHLLLPPSFRASLPDVANTWSGFRAGARAGPGSATIGWSDVGILHREVPRAVDSFLARIDRAATSRGPSLIFFHLNLPHLPWRYLPSGREYMPDGMPLLPPGFENPRLADDEQRTIHGLQRHILQVGYADRVLGQLTDRLRSAGIYDRAMVIVTADHGCSFRPGEERRKVTESNIEDVLEVPLFVKRPGQDLGSVQEHVVRTVDIVPTIAAALGEEPPWETDGILLSDTSPREITACCYAPPEPPFGSFSTDPARRQQTLNRLNRLFGSGTGSSSDRSSDTGIGQRRSESDATAPQDPATDPFDGVFAVGPRADLLGRPAADFSNQSTEGESPMPHVVLSAKHSYDDVKPTTGFVPSLISGRLEPRVRHGTKLAISVDGIVRATTETFTHRRISRFMALVPERWLPAGSRQIGIYLIDETSGTGKDTLLRPLPGEESPPRLALENGRAAGVVLAGGERLTRADDLFDMTSRLLSGGILGFLVHEPGKPPPPLDEFLLFDGATLLYRGADDPWLRHTRTRRDDQIETAFRIFTPAVTADRAESLRLLARSGDRFQDVSPSTSLPGMFEMMWSDQGRVKALLRRPMNHFNTEPERIDIVSSRDGIVGFLGARSEDSAAVPGWVIDLNSPGTTLEVVAFLAGRQIWVDNVKFPRRDVVSRYGPEHRASGFNLFDELRLAAGSRNELTPVDIDTLRREGVLVYAVSPRGFAARVRFRYRPLLRQSRNLEVLPVTDGRLLTVRPPGDGFDGAIDLVTKPGNRTLIEGWAADLERGEAPRQIVIYRDGEFLGNLGANRERPDVAEHHGDERLLWTGFRGRVPGAPGPETFADRHRVFALMLRGVAVELPYALQADLPH